ncbi:uncharacterized protein LOC141701535 isoform X2 [Apium graveolens]|uniref:Secreted protein n=2 Tax=Apium graveolens TaxID=4045 RepID=A0A6L5BA63_APIGR|nr:hypothetical protein AG4045_003250 [Apium graveolens]
MQLQAVAGCGLFIIIFMTVGASSSGSGSGSGTGQGNRSGMGRRESERKKDENDGSEYMGDGDDEDEDSDDEILIQKAARSASEGHYKKRPKDDEPKLGVVHFLDGALFQRTILPVLRHRCLSKLDKLCGH